MKLSQLTILFALTNQLLIGSSHPFDSSTSNKDSRCCQKCALGSSRFLATDSENWYTITAPNFPNSVLLSRNSNQGFKEGAVRVTPTGLKLNEAGNYSVSFTAIIASDNAVDTLFIPVFISVNSVFDPFNTTNIGSVTILPPGGGAGAVQGSGIIHNAKKGTTLSLVTANTSTPNPENLTVINWSISAFKIPCESH